MNNLSVCGEACNCVKCRVSEFSIEYKEPAYTPSPEEVDQSIADAMAMNENMRIFGTIDIPKPVRFHELADGAQFMLASTYAYSRRVYVKAMEDGDNHNAVSVHNSSIGIALNDNTLVLPIKE